MDVRLEARLRVDPTGDPVHVRGRFRDHVATAATVRARPRRGVVALRPIGSLVVAAVVVATVVVLRPLILVPGTSPPPTPSPSPLATVGAGQVQGVVDGWRSGRGLSVTPGISVSAVTPGGIATYVAGDLPAGTILVGRIGEVSRLYLSAGVVVVDRCTRSGNARSCPAPAPGATLTLDDLVARWYPPWPAADPTTVRDLLEGTSGLAATGPTIAELAASIAADPGGDWSRDTVLARAISAPRRFAPGTQRQPVDTEALLLEAILERASGRSTDEGIPLEIYPPFSTRFADEPPEGLQPGVSATGDPIGDLDPTLLRLLGNAGGMASSSQDLAEYAGTLWAQIGYLDREAVDLLSDAANGHANPIAATVICCDQGAATVIARTGHAVGWSAVIAYNFATGTAIGVVVARDLPDGDLLALVNELAAAVT